MSNETTNNISLIKLPDVPESVDNSVKNITDVPTKNIGQTFGDLWYLVFGGISHAADKKRMKYAHDLQIYNQELNAAIEQIPEEDKTEPSIQTTAQALENSKYCVSSDILRKMFVNLISGTMNKRFEPHVHPSFPEILKQMSENDALFVQAFKYQPNIPIANLCLKFSNLTSVAYVKDVCILPNSSLDVAQCWVSISALQRAGLLEITYTECLSNDSEYEKIRKSSIYTSLHTKAQLNNCTAVLQKGICRLTNLGREFVKVCV